MSTNKPCIIEGCNKFRRAKQYCSPHLKEFMPEFHRAYYDRRNKIRKERYESDKEYREKTRIDCKRRNKKYFLNRYHNDPEWKKEYLRKIKPLRIKHRKSLKLKVLEHYSNGIIRCMCKNCNETFVEFMSIDHINGRGNEHRKIIGGGGITTYRWLKNNNFPDGFRVLCYNCNISIAFMGYCPHEKMSVMG